MQRFENFVGFPKTFSVLAVAFLEASYRGESVVRNTSTNRILVNEATITDYWKGHDDMRTTDDKCTETLNS